MLWDLGLETAGVLIQGLTVIGLLLLTVLAYLYVTLLRSIKRDNRTFSGINRHNVYWLILVAGLLGIYSLCFYLLPSAFLAVPDWQHLALEHSRFVYLTASLWFSIGLLTILYYTLNFSYQSKDNYNLVAITTLGIFSGVSSSFIIMVIHQATTNEDNLLLWVPFFALAVCFSAATIKVVQSRLVNITNQVVYRKRTEFIGKVLSSDFHQIENMEKGNIEACLNNDTEIIGGFPGTFISVITGLVATLGCLAYLGLLYIDALIIILLALLVTLVPMLFIFIRVIKHWEENRTMQSSFFKYIAELIHGLKELKLKQSKRHHFQQDMVSVTRRYVETQILGNQAIVNVRVIVELIFYITIGTVLFTFPLIYDDLSSSDASSFLLIYIFMMAQVTILAVSVPDLLKIKVSWDRINVSLENMTSLQQQNSEHTPDRPHVLPIKLSLENICYHYRNMGSEFTLGPLSCEFESGQITFITGGNGSGKSTLAKLITGLYKPDSGVILVNGTNIERDALGEHFSTVFSDFHLFEKLYGIDSGVSEPAIDNHIHRLALTDKLSIHDGIFSTTQLSTGQRKRIALLVTYLEDSPILLFDEWAADQDPQFRKYFYTELLPELKRRGKCVIAITHDEKYFGTADQLIHMESGSITLDRKVGEMHEKSEEDGTCLK